MTAFPTCPVPSESSPSSLEALREVASPRDPLAFWELEQQVRQQAHRQADQILGYHLSRLHQDAAFVQAAIEKVRKESPIPLIHKGYKTVSVRLPGGTRFLVKTPYLRPNHRGKRGPKRTRRGPKGVGHYPVLEAVGIRDGVSPATRSQLALYTVQAGSYQEAVHLLAERGFQVDPSTLARIAQATAQTDISLREIALEQARSLPLPEKGLLAGKRVRISIDGGRLRTRKAKKGRKTRRGRHRFTTPWREPRMLVIDILKEDGSTDPLRLPLYDVLLGNAQATFALVLGYLRLLGAAQAQVIVFIADGAPWIWERTHWLRLQAGIPADKWVEVIDFYHASQHLHATLDLCRTLSPAQREALFEQLRHTLRTDPNQGRGPPPPAVAPLRGDAKGSKDEQGPRLLRATRRPHGLCSAGRPAPAGRLGPGRKRHTAGHQPPIQGLRHLLEGRNRRRADASARHFQGRTLGGDDAAGLAPNLYAT